MKYLKLTGGQIFAIDRALTLMLAFQRDDYKSLRILRVLVAKTDQIYVAVGKE